MKVDVLNTAKQKVGEVELEDSVFKTYVKPWLFWEVVRMQRANRRAGTHSTKTVSDVSGTGKKPYRQKGTGRARQGSLRATHMRGGGTVHKPHPRDYSYRMPKKMVQGALRSALSQRLKEQRLYVVQGWAPHAPKTKEALGVLGKFEAGKALIVDTNTNETLMKSLRNLPSAKFLPVEALNVYDILAYDHLFISEAAVSMINERLKSFPSRRDEKLKARAG